MKRAAAVGKRFGLHPDTVRNWTKQFEEFFSPEARATQDLQRQYTYDDEIVVNTIHELRRQRVDWEEIRARLANGDRVTTLPQINEPVPPETALAIYNEVRELKTKIEERDAEIERLRNQIAGLHEGYEEKLITMAREAEKWKARYEILLEQQPDDDEDE